MTARARRAARAPPAAVADGPPFAWAAGSVAGSDHRRAGRNCQDAVRVLGDADALVAVVADGCGGAPHSEVGAHLLAQLLAVHLLAAAPAALGGALVIGGSVECERWLQALRAARGDAPWRRVPTGVGEDRLIGGLDVAATLSAGTRVLARGLLAEAHGGTLALPRAADAAPGTVGLLARTLDDGEVLVERDGLSARHESAVCVAAAAGPDEREQLGATLLERLALHVVLPDGYEPSAPAARVTDFARVVPEPPHVVALAQVADALGLASPRALLLAVRAARAAAAVSRRDAPRDDDLALAVSLVLAPRATRVPPPPADDEVDAGPQENGGASDKSDASGAEGEAEQRAGPPSDLLIEAARAALPPALLDANGAGRARPGAHATQGRRGAEQRD
ncbi:protein phosphatase 2C domain-containing protein, partial [Roseisolibacter sp. H3M3-2]|uniref:protein phosphatase 2C domain-containing protein n=1 Tax=Roseisolibacter sp. H3M3-2 TaxID=3031323 RepID=UPI0023DA696E